MKKLKPGIDPVALMKAVKQCDGDVFFLTKNDQLDLILFPNSLAPLKKIW